MRRQQINEVTRHLVESEPDQDTIKRTARHSMTTIGMLDHDVFTLQRHELLQGVVAKLAVAVDGRDTTGKRRHESRRETGACSDFQNPEAWLQVQRRDGTGAPSGRAP